MNKIIAILLADIHLSHAPPSARSVEEDWYGAMKRTLDELRDLVAASGSPPVICAGDVFDRWQSPPELVNFAIQNLPRMYAVPGQHDLPLHNYDGLRKSAYQTLVEAGKIVNLPPGEPFHWSSTLGPSRRSLCAVGFPYGFEVKKFAGDADGALKVSVIHDYVWAQSYCYAGAPKEKRITKFRKQLEGYDVAVFGDNHIGFRATTGDCEIWNCGTLMRRKMDEKQLRPRLGFLMEDGCIDLYYLKSVEKDVFADPLELAPESPLEMRVFLQELAALEKDSWDFAEAVNRYVENNHLDEGTKRVLMEVLEG